MMNSSFLNCVDTNRSAFCRAFPSLKPGNSSKRSLQVNAGTAPPPAWPGRVGVPESIPKLEGPKVRSLLELAGLQCVL